MVANANEPQHHLGRMAGKQEILSEVSLNSTGINASSTQPQHSTQPRKVKWKWLGCCRLRSMSILAKLFAELATRDGCWTCNYLLNLKSSTCLLFIILFRDFYFKHSHTRAASNLYPFEEPSMVLFRKCWSAEVRLPRDAEKQSCRMALADGT